MQGNIFKKIWHDPVFSKVISACIITYILPNLSSFILYITGFKTDNELISKFVFFGEFVKTHFLIILLLFFFFLLVIFVIFFLKEAFSVAKPLQKKFQKKDEKWLINCIEQEIQKYLFLLWFPLKGETVGVIHLPASEKLRVFNSRTFKLLESKNVVNRGYFDYSVSIDELAFKILDNYLKKDYTGSEEQKKFIAEMKNMEFVDILLNCVFVTDYD